MIAARPKCLPLSIAALLATLILLDLPAAPVPKPEYVFIPTHGQKVCICQGQDWLQGQLDADGNFSQTSPYKSSRANFLRSAGFPVLSAWHGYDVEKAAPAYEFRSGRLIRGVQEWDGTFVPELGSEVKMFSEYRVGDPKELPIWNRTGFIMRKEFAERYGLQGRPLP